MGALHINAPYLHTKTTRKALYDPSPTTNDPKFLEAAHGISFNHERNKFEASVRVLNEETGNFDDFILGYFETKEWAARVRDAW